MTIRDDVYEWMDNHGGEVADLGRRCAADYLLEHTDIDSTRSTIATYIDDWREDHDTAPNPARQADEGASVWDEDYLQRKSLDDRHYYNDEDDVHLFWLDHYPHPMPIQGDDYRSMKRAYSNWAGDESTIAEIQREFGISRQDFREIKTIAGWTHDSEPFAREEYENRDRDERLQDLHAMEVRKDYREHQKRKWKRTEEHAKRWRQFNRDVFDPMLEAIQEAPKRTSRAFEPSTYADATALNIFATDAHLDARTLEGGIDENIAHFLGAHEDALSWATGASRPERIYLVLGSDQFHIDTSQGTTTAGTHIDHDTLARRSVRQPAQAGCRLVERARDIAPVVLRVLPGNHDERTCQLYLMMLEERYADCEDVDVRGNAEPYQYEKYGESLIGWHHGHGIGGGATQKEPNLTSKMLSDVREWVGECRYRYWYLGHQHQLWADEGASLVEQATSTKAHDAFEDKQGFPEGHRCATHWLYAKDEGQKARFMGTA